MVGGVPLLVNWQLGEVVKANSRTAGKDDRERTLSKYFGNRPDTMFQCIATILKPSCVTFIWRVLCIF
jgi:hypothetical protein